MTDTLTLQAIPLTRAAFAPYGDVIEMRGHTPSPMNQGWAERYHDLADVDMDEPEGRTAISLARSRPETAPVSLRLVERHPLASQAFVPLGPQPFLVVVAPAGAVPTRDMLEAFVSNGAQGVNYRKGIWHHPMIALEAVSDFLIVDRKGPGNNCDEAAIAGGKVEVRL